LACSFAASRSKPVRACARSAKDCTTNKTDN
jgi:hypothetical protein